MNYNDSSYDFEELGKYLTIQIPPELTTALTALVNNTIFSPELMRLAETVKIDTSWAEALLPFWNDMMESANKAFEGIDFSALAALAEKHISYDDLLNAQFQPTLRAIQRLKGQTFEPLDLPIPLPTRPKRRIGFRPTY